MEITPEIVVRVASLARLSLTEEELGKFSGQLAELLAYFEKLRELDTSKVEPTAHVAPLRCPRRQDQIRPDATLEREVLLGQAPAQDADHFVVPKVID